MTSTHDDMLDLVDEEDRAPEVFVFHDGMRRDDVETLNTAINAMRILHLVGLRHTRHRVVQYVEEVNIVLGVLAKYPDPGDVCLLGFQSWVNLLTRYALETSLDAHGTPVLESYLIDPERIYLGVLCLAFPTLVAKDQDFLLTSAVPCDRCSWTSCYLRGSQKECPACRIPLAKSLALKAMALAKVKLSSCVLCRKDVFI